MSESTFIAESGDGRVRSSNATYLTARSGANLMTDSSGYVGRDVDTGTYYLNQSYISFDTSSIPDEAIVSSAVLSVYYAENVSTTDFTVEARLKDWGAALGTDDFVAGADLAALPLLATFATSAIHSPCGFASESGFAAAINKTGYTRILLSSDGLRSTDANVDSSFLKFRLGSDAEPQFRPQLVVSYGIPMGRWFRRRGRNGQPDRVMRMKG